MNTLLIEALRGLDLRPGQTYRAQVDGRTVELRVVEEGPTPEVVAGVMLQPWVELPFEAAGTVQAHLGALPLPDPPTIPADEELP
jgi:hypothetical protein